MYQRQLILRRVIALRYRLLPYIYSAAAETCRTGLPLVRAMMTAFPENPNTAVLHNQYLFGDALLVKPVTRPLSAGGDRTEVVLPPGGWYNLFILNFTEEGTVSVLTPLSRFPVFVRAGSILPLASGASCAEEASVRELCVFCGADGAFTLYDDDGDGPAEGWRLPLRYAEAAGDLVLGPGGIPLRLAVRFISPDGSIRQTEAVYSGRELRIRRDPNP